MHIFLNKFFSIASHEMLFAGHNRMYDDLEMMLGSKPNRWWKICWCFISPLCLLVSQPHSNISPQKQATFMLLLLQCILIFTLVLFTRPTYDKYVYPWWGVLIGWCLSLCSILPIPGFMLYKLLTTKGDVIEVRDPIESLRRYVMALLQKINTSASLELQALDSAAFGLGSPT